MNDSEQMNPTELKMQALIDRFLNASLSDDKATTVNEPHLDEDSLAAFTEGSLSVRESQPIISHLAACSFCLHISAQLLRLDLDFSANQTVRPAADGREPSKVSDVLSGLLSRIFGTTDGAVFAHSESDQETEKSELPEKGK